MAVMRWLEEMAPGRGVQLHVRRVVDPPAPPVLLLHGLGVSGVIWQGFARRLLPYLGSVAPDLRGHGQSDAPPSGYTPSDYADDLAVLIEDYLQPLPGSASPSAGHAPVPVVGHSLGALVAMRLAEQRPDLVAWAALLDPPLDPGIHNPEVPSVERLRHAPGGELEAYLLDRNPSGGPLLAQTLATLFRQAADGVFEGLPRRADAAEPPARAIERPVLLLQADPERGGLLGDAAARAFVDAQPNARLIKIPGATHALHASQPAEVARAILRFGGYSSDGSASV